MLLTSATAICWQDLRTDFYELDAGHDYDRSMPHMFGICVFRNSGYCRILHQDFWLMLMDLCLHLELSMENYASIFLADVWSHKKKLLG